MRQLIKDLILWLIGGFLYVIIELLYRGRTHWTMFILGGICFVAIGLINKYLSWETPLIVQALIGAIIVTILEFITGCIVNLWLGWDVWNYSRMPFNLLGQVCLPYFVLWIGLSIIAIILDDYLRYWLFAEEKPRYILI